jgi:hypothetical protein
LTTCEEKQARLAVLEAAYDASLTGQVTEITTGPKTLRYGQANIGLLRAEIANLRSQVAACTGIPDRTAHKIIGMIPRESSSCGPFRR